MQRQDGGGRAEGAESLGHGAIVLAAYRPPADLFRVQLASIQNQTIRDFDCLITADGGAADVEALVRDAVGDDARFRVIGYDNRLGFYANFERGLAAVPPTARWVALSDQDDRWYPAKLERLLPTLADRSLVSGQSRVVAQPGERVVSQSTRRKSLEPRYFVLENQFTGGSTVLRRDVLDLALPFPQSDSASQFHDHWLAVCAAAQAGAEVLDVVVQDYIQHGANVIGEGEKSFSPIRSLRNALRLTYKAERGGGPRAIAATVYDVGVGWREVMAAELARRVPESAVSAELSVLFGPSRHVMMALRTLLIGVVGRKITPRATLEYAAGLALAGAKLVDRHTRGAGSRFAARSQ
ncbi:glycosyltransferase [Sinomonas sp. ASV486]|uniref:glycosyltransferase n=1 Tax=Sinomonas sp. ASV486 TaxID=3051170 RepID=UPI0027DE197A|nr:glycosyltransferase [Sinomonas sp. ASV486]MDQ4490980.1 glycosyltransferase [Sinomonas sp. ASV486]